MKKITLLFVFAFLTISCQAQKTNLDLHWKEFESLEKKENFLTNGFDSKYYEIKPKTGGLIKSLIVVGKDRFYEAMFGITPEIEKKLNESKVDYNEIGRKFIDSFQVIEK